MAETASLISGGEGIDFDESKTALDHFLDKLTAGITGVLYIMSKDVSGSAPLVVLGMLIDFFQMLTFLFYKSIDWKWDPSVTSWLASAVNVSQLVSLGGTGINTKQVIFFSSLGLVLIVLLDAVWVGWQFSQQRIRYIFTVKFLRSFSDLVVGPLFIPIVGVFAKEIPCYDGTLSCWSKGSHIAYVCISTFVGIFYIALCIMLSGAYYSRDPTGDNPAARPTSRVIMAQLCVKTILTITFIILSPFHSMRWVLVCLLLAGTCSVAWLYSYFMPYYRFDFNVLRACTFWLLSWGSICLAVLEFSTSDTETQTAGSFMFYVGCPVVVVVSIMGMRYRRTNIMLSSLPDLRSPSEIELKVRFSLEKLTEARRLLALGHGNSTAGSVIHASGSSDSVYKDSADSAQSDSMSDNGSSLQGEESRGGRALQKRMEQLVNKQRIIEESKQLEEADAIYSFGARRFGHHAWMHLLRAQHCFFYLENKSVALNHLSHAESRNPQVDETFSIYYLRKLAHESFSGGEGNTDILQYIQMQKTLADAKKYDEISVRHTLAFWDVLLSSQPELNRMNEFAELINSSMLSASEAFRRLMRLSGGNSIPVLRMYASFLLDVANELEHANDLLTRAEELENAHSKDHGENGMDGAVGPSLDDRHAIVSISADLKKLGQILSVNAAAMRLLGYNKYELIGRNINVLVPLPYSPHHQGFLLRYMDIGNSTILNKNRPVFGLHKSGYLVYLNLFVREVSGENEHAFLGVLREHVTHVQMGIIDQNYNVFGCTAGLGSMFAFSPEEMRTGSLHLSRWISNFDSRLQDLTSPSGAEFQTMTTDGTDVRVRAWLSPLPVGGEVSKWHLLRAQVLDMQGRAMGNKLLTKNPKTPGMFSPTLSKSNSQSSMLPTQTDTADDSGQDSDSDESSGSDRDDDGKVRPGSDYKSIAALEKSLQEQNILPLPSLKPLMLHQMTLSPPQNEPSNFKPPLRLMRRKSVSNVSPSVRFKPEDHASPTNAQPLPPLLSPAVGFKSIFSTPSPKNPQEPATPFSVTSEQQNLLKTDSAMSPPGYVKRMSMPFTPTPGSVLKSNVEGGQMLRTLSRQNSIRLQKLESDDNKAFVGRRGRRNAISISLAQAAQSAQPPATPEDDDNDDKKSNRSGGSNSSAGGGQTIHSKFMTFARSRDSKEFSPALGRLRISLMLTMIVVLVASILNFVLVNTRITAYTQNLSDISIAGVRRSDPITFSLMLYQMLLAKMGFYPISLVNKLKAELLPLRLLFEQSDNNLYLVGDAHANILDDPNLVKLYQSPVVPLTILQQSKFLIQMKSMWDATQQLEFSITDVIVKDLSGLSFYDSSFYFVLRNSDAALLTALNQSVFLYQANTVSAIVALRNWSLALTVVPLLVLLVVVAALVRPTVRTVEDNKMSVLRLFLDIPVPLVRVFRSRIARHLSTIENADDGALTARRTLESETADTLEFLNEEDEEAVIEQVLMQIRSENAATPFTSQVKIASELGGRPFNPKIAKDREAERKHRQARADDVGSANYFFRRNLTIIKITSYILFAFLYFIITYQVFFNTNQASWTSKPFQVNWSSHRTLSIRMISFHLVQYLTQNYTGTWFPRPPEVALPLVTLTELNTEINFIYNLIVALGMGSETFGTLAPETADQISVNFVNACIPGIGQPADCASFADRAMASGTYAAMLSWTSQARHMLTSIQSTHAAVQSLQSSNATLLQQMQFNLINNTLNGRAMQTLLAYDMLYLYPVTGFETAQYIQVASSSLTNVSSSKTLVLILWIAFTLLFYMLFFSPLVLKLHTEQRRTTSMLLMITPEVMEHIPSIRTFVTRLSSNADEM